VTFQNPFQPMQIFNSGVTDYDILLGAAGVTPPPPPPTQTIPLRLLLVRNSSDPASRRVVYKANSPRDNLKFFAGPTVGGATLKVKLDTVTQCFAMPASGWSRFGRTYTYADPGGSHGPVKAAQFKQTRTGGIQNRALIIGANGPVGIVPPNPGVEGDTNFHIGGQRRVLRLDGRWHDRPEQCADLQGVERPGAGRL